MTFYTSERPIPDYILLFSVNDLKIKFLSYYDVNCIAIYFNVWESELDVLFTIENLDDRIKPVSMFA